MQTSKPKTSVSFPITVSFAEDGRALRIERRTDPCFEARLRPGAGGDPDSAALYLALVAALRKAGVQSGGPDEARVN